MRPVRFWLAPIVVVSADVVLMPIRASANPLKVPGPSGFCLAPHGAPSC